MMEGKVVLAAVARVLRWTKVGLSGRYGEEEVYTKHNVIVAKRNVCHGGCFCHLFTSTQTFAA